MILKAFVIIILLVFSGTNFYLTSWNLVQFYLKQKQAVNQLNSKLYYLYRTIPYYSLIIMSVIMFASCFVGLFTLFV